MAFEAGMIPRIWHGRVPASKADAYHQYLLETGVSDYAETPGNCGVYVLRRLDADSCRGPRRPRERFGGILSHCYRQAS